MNLRPLAFILAAALLQGCISVHSYVDPQYHHASYSDLKRVDPPYVLRVTVEFQVNGTPKPKAERTLQDDVFRALRASGVAVPYEGTGPVDGDLSVVLNNLANLGGAAAKGVGTGLTLGLVGSHVTDPYEMTARLTQGDVVVERKYQHALISTVGNASGPEGLTPLPPSTAFSQVIDDLVLNLLKDMQTDGKLLARSGGH